MMIVMMRRCPIQHREACSSSKNNDETSNVYNYNQIHRILVRIGPWWSLWCVDSGFSIEKPVALQTLQNHEKSSIFCLCVKSEKIIFFFPTGRIRKMRQAIRMQGKIGGRMGEAQWTMFFRKTGFLKSRDPGNSGNPKKSRMLVWWAATRSL